MKATKYGNHRMYLNRKTGSVFPACVPLPSLSEEIVCFHSKWELKVYQSIRNHFLDSWVSLQAKVLLKGKSIHSGSVNYFCDFLISPPPLLRLDTESSCDYLLIEAKGYLTPAASMKLKLLEVTSPITRSNLLIVSEKPQHYFGKNYPPSIDLFQLDERLIEFKIRLLSNRYES